MLSDKHDPHPDIKIIDFGMAHSFIQGEEYKSLGGTPQYIGESFNLCGFVSNYLRTYAYADPNACPIPQVRDIHYHSNTADDKKAVIL